MKLSPEELATQTLNPETLEEAVQQVRVNGYVVFESALPLDFIQELLVAYMEVYESYLQDPDPTFGKNHYRVFLPFRAPFNDERVINNPLATPVLEALLGKDFTCHYFASNPCAPGSDHQAVHADIFPLFPASEVTPPAYHAVLNIPLVDNNEENGPMDIWPGGSHLSTIPPEQMEKLAPVMPYKQDVMPAGSVMVRNGRMWHRGTPNRSNAPRPNLALVYNRPWLNVAGRVGIPQDELIQTI